MHPVVRRSLGPLLLSAVGPLLASSCGGEADRETLATVAQPLCTSATIFPDDPDYKAKPGQIVTWAISTQCEFADRQVQVYYFTPSGAKVVVENWTTASQVTWNTTGAALGNYSWYLLVREAGSTRPYETYHKRIFTLVSLEPCSTVSANSSPGSPSAIGDPVTMTATATCDVAPIEYEYLHLVPGGSVYSVARAYSTDPAFVWETASEATGGHLFRVNARNQGSTAVYEARSDYRHDLQLSTLCTSANLVLTPTRSAVVGSLVGFSASASGCGLPEYQFLVQPPSGLWQVLRDWDSDSSFVWSTDGWAESGYTLDARARALGTTRYTAVARRSFTLTAATSPALRKLSAGAQYACAVHASGSVSCWGYNSNGQLGNGSTTLSAAPVAVSGLASAVAIDGGYYHNCAIVSGGGVRCWGADSHGQLGNGSTTDSSVPVSVQGLGGAVSIASGTAHSCAVLGGGTVSCWGYNSRGQLGNGSVNDSSVPVSVSGLSSALKVAAGYYHSCALLSPGSVRCWGRNSEGQLGNGTTTASAAPVVVSEISNAVDVVAAANHSCALLADGTIRCWGENGTGVFGNGLLSNSLVPTAATGVNSAVSLDTGARHTCTVLSGGTVSCWGANSRGALGNGTTTDSALPVDVQGLTGVEHVAVGHDHSCALLDNASVWCWGYNSVGQLGTGTTGVGSTVPVAVTTGS